ncbi:MAG: phosphoadenosine phosphosulfate reductase [Rhodobacteraceae bacterium]|nr:phosphoadenosine phosphosulfate reductase [Paracoccaceae bacterium]
MSDMSAQSWINDAPLGEPRDVWQARIAAIQAEDGFFEALGANHSALYVKRGQTLIVSFENLHDVYRHGENRLPWGLGKDQPADWSVLGVMAHAPTWYRDTAVLDFFDRLKDDGFFDQFDQIIFYGVSMGAYAACAFSSAAPGSTVIAISPQATLNPDLTSWETRFSAGRRRNFSTRYGYAPDMLAEAEHAYLFYDPSNSQDAMHMVLFQGANLTKLKCRYMGQMIATYWHEMQIHDTVVERCIDQNLPDATFYQLQRARHASSRYQKEILERLLALENHPLVVRYCNGVLARRRGPAFRRELNNSLRILGRPE